MIRVTPQPHHVRGVECDSRPIYRRGRRPTAAKTFTIADESVHVLVFGVPAVQLFNELAIKAHKFGEVNVSKVDDYPGLEEFTELYHLHYKTIPNARAAKKHLDGLEFFGGILHVCYAPELETLDETRAKLVHRSKIVQAKIPSHQAKSLRKFE